MFSAAVTNMARSNARHPTLKSWTFIQMATLVVIIPRQPNNPFQLAIYLLAPSG